MQKAKPSHLSALFLKYYRDVTLYNLAFSVICWAICGLKVIAAVIIFATLGTLVSYWVYSYFQNIEYYFYINGGLSKLRLQIKTAVINLLISSVILIVLWRIS